MPLGDSITEGYSSGVDVDEKMISYRLDLWRSLISAGYSVEFVGGFNSGSYYAPEGFDPNHEGHSGWTPKQIDDEVYNFLTANPADVVLLHIGTNGLGTTNSTVTRVEDILDSIDQYETDKNTEVTVLVARIINRVSTSPTTTAFNNDVAAMVQARQTAGDKVSMVDMETGAGLVYSVQPSGDMWDNLHPYATGYTKMAAVWFSALQGILPQCQTAPVIISTPTTDATVGTPYSYDVNAMGNPTPTYALSAPIPSGMTINATTGVISWTPNATGSVNVTVTATNSQGTATQNFVINVASQTPPVFTSSPITQGFVGQVYGYDVDATGVPQPTYSLAAPIPSGMTINATTGVISWTPNATGSVNVTVTATNSQGSANQSFVITVTASVCPADMSAHWKLDEVGSPTNFIDSYGGNNGTCTPGSCPTPGAGIVNGGLVFNGNHMVDVPNSASFNWANSDSFSLEAWIKPAQACTGTEVILGKYASSGATWWLGCEDGSNTAGLFLRDSTSNTLTLEGTKDLNDGQWHHLVATRNAATNEHHLYVDGVSEASSTYSFTGTFSNSSPLNLGYYITNSPDFPFIGTLDEVAIYKRVLSSGEITSHYNAGSGQAYCGQQAPVIISTPVTEVTVNQPYSYDVNATGNPTPTYALVAPIPAGMTINSTTGVISWTPTAVGSVNVTVNASNSKGTATQSFVITVAALSAPVITSTPVTQAAVGEAYNYDVDAVGSPTPTYDLAAPVPSGMTINPTTGVISWTPTASGPVNVTVTASNSEGTATQTFTINVAVSVCPADIISYWKLNEVGSPTSFADSHGTNTATCTADSCPTPSTGIIGGAMSFSGDDIVNVADSASLDWTNSDSFTLEAWIKTTQVCAGNEVILGKYAANGATWWLGCEDGSNTAAFSLRDSTNTDLYLSDTKALNDGKWHHLVASRNAGNNVHQLYVDGALKSTVTQALTGNFSNNNPLNLGYFLTNSPHYFFNGTLDEVAIYKRALTQAEITEHYNAGSGRAYCGERPPKITSTPVTVALKSALYTYDVNATGNPTPTYELPTHPTGMTINATTGVISWTPNTLGTFNVTVKAINSEGTASQTFTIEVADHKSAPNITSTPVTQATIGEAYSYDVNATGLPMPTYSLVAPVPTGMTIDATTGVINWTPNAVGTFNVTVKGINSEGTATQSFSIKVANVSSPANSQIFLPFILK
ncbi:MAG: putative Ig domain-containing protein [Anaerolineae bacterium]|nr:putative Ig domain-containing protein [Anaerolineae bacterium]